MNVDKNTAKAEMEKLVNRFAQNREAYHSSGYNETQARVEYINPFWKCLGWDVDNEEGAIDAYKEVIHEDKVRVSGHLEAPDYCFKINNDYKFYVEAKKPGVDLNADPNPAYQIRNYGWNKKLAVSVLTDFEEFVVYDCGRRPKKGDKPSISRIKYLASTEYLTEFDFLWDTFSREAVRTGKFDKYARSESKTRGIETVDKEFLKSMDAWRFELAKNIAVNNPKIASDEEMSRAVQLIIDRILFLRVCEGRGVEHHDTLRDKAGKDDCYKGLCAYFGTADQKYNSGLFDFKKDTLTPGLAIDDKVVKSILNEMYEGDYNFSIIPVEILGNAYEQFLGKVIRLTSGHHAKVEEKPEVRKAGGVYYTPQYIVDYIVKNTVGKMLEGKTPKEAAKLRICDPACGSGSFLLGAYQYLLDWHLRYYIKNKAAESAPEFVSDKKFKQKAKEGPLTPNGSLSTAEKKKILLNNVYGVDIDPQAVEVTKLSLLLKALEGETEASIRTERTFWNEPVLPSLENNIKCGNSLIGPDYFSAQQVPDAEELKRVNPFDWKSAFPGIFKAGGFDAVIGNPPYVYRNVTEENMRPYLLSKYTCAEGNFECYKFFLEKAISLINENRYLGMILSASFLIQNSFTKLRKLLLEKEIIYLSPLGPKVFDGATVDTAIIIIRNSTPSKISQVNIQAPKSPEKLMEEKPYCIEQQRFFANANYIFDYKLDSFSASIIKRIFSEFPNIECGFEFGVGINTGFIKNELVANTKLNSHYHPMVSGDGISRYGIVKKKNWIMYDKEYVQSRGKLGRTLPQERFLSSTKILIVRTRNLSLKQRLIATIDEDGIYNLNRLSNIIARVGHNLYGLLGFLNSKLFNWIFSTRFFDYEIKPIYLRECPCADTNNQTLISFAENMLKLNKRLASVGSIREQESLQRLIDDTDQKIDALVYELYGLTGEEIKIVEESK